MGRGRGERGLWQWMGLQYGIKENGSIDVLLHGNTTIKGAT
jgi:hypothetical protein